MKEITEAENTRLPSGDRVMDVMSNLWYAIVESRKIHIADYDGPVSRDEGGEHIKSMVRHYIGTMAGERDPVSREKPHSELREEEIVGGFDVYIIGDKSGSMSSTVDGEALWKMQRRAVYLLFSSLYNFGERMKQAGIHGDTALDVRTQAISFRGENVLDEDKPLSAQFNAVDKVALWNSLTDASGGNGDFSALSSVYDTITDEIAQEKDKNKKRLRIVIACSDGGYIGDDSVTMPQLAKKLQEETGAIVVGMGLTETANSVPVVMHNPPHSYGDMVRDINNLPAKVAEHIIGNAIKLFPAKAQANAETMIAEAIAKFKNIQ